jgi:hypothetical protein
MKASGACTGTHEPAIADTDSEHDSDEFDLDMYDNEKLADIMRSDGEMAKVMLERGAKRMSGVAQKKWVDSGGDLFAKQARKHGQRYSQRVNTMVDGALDKAALVKLEARHAASEAVVKGVVRAKVGAKRARQQLAKEGSSEGKGSSGDGSIAHIDFGPGVAKGPKKAAKAKK